MFSIEVITSFVNTYIVFKQAGQYKQQHQYKVCSNFLQHENNQNTRIFEGHEQNMMKR
jgi:hypothetical protein